jgi:hypothetical protein
MATDYILFIHGVNVRNENYADGLYEQLKIGLSTTTRTIKPLTVYWGDITEPLEQKLLSGYEGSSIWENLWFKQLRQTVLIRSAGDVALYITRVIGSEVARRVAQKIATISKPTCDDRLHLVTHSLGTIILFDILFSARWQNPTAPGYPEVMAIRDAVYGITGLSGNCEQGVLLGSITTMGSPIGLFTLLDTDLGKSLLGINNNEFTSTHDIIPDLMQLLDYRYKALEGTAKDKRLPWRNFVHPGDLIASPIEKIVPDFLHDPNGKYVNVQDILVSQDLQAALSELRENFSDAAIEALAGIFKQTTLALLQTGIAHNSYWVRADVAKEIEVLIQSAS